MNTETKIVMLPIEQLEHHPENPRRRLSRRAQEEKVMADENKKAHWIDVTSELWSRLGFKHYQCSACGYATGIKTDKCFICGAKMNTEE